MAIVAVDLGSSPTGAGGDTNREAFTKLNASIVDLDERGLGVDGADGVGVPAGGTTGQVNTKLSNTDYDTGWATPAAAVLEAVEGGAGFVDKSGAVALDLASARAFHHTMIGSITGLSFTNVPTATAFSATWTWVLRIDATGGYSLSGTPTVTWMGGSSWADLDLSANAENVVSFTRVGSITYAALLWNGALVDGVSINAQTGTTYTLTLADAGKLVTLANGAAITVTVPTNASVEYPVGTVISLQQYGAGAVTVVGATGVTINGTTPGNKALTAGQYTTTATLTKHATDTWTLAGSVS